MGRFVEWLLETDFSTTKLFADSLYCSPGIAGTSKDTPHKFWFDTVTAKVAYFKNDEWNEQVKAKLAEIEAMLKVRLEAEQLENGSAVAKTMRLRSRITNDGAGEEGE
ncbi:hypothetical protein TrVE_jg6746 [Triparma verrucosa]|uniref:Uncharacterized protein n=1 Tax=Triparma verrucosa TaxID=1606542 RepID=A0A9W7BKT2_9STRA|nr:hypothetical protein TrVE_jg6746 [Triparma verrucosa]